MTDDFLGNMVDCASLGLVVIFVILAIPVMILLLPLVAVGWCVKYVDHSMR